MTKYYVENIKGVSLYEGLDEDTAYRLCRQYNNVCGETYAVYERATDLDDFDEKDDNTYVFYCNNYLTSLYGDDDAIKEDMKMAIEYKTRKGIIDFDLNYNDPGDSGNGATFWARNIKWESVKKCVKDCTINEINSYILKKVGPGAEITGIHLTAFQGVLVYWTTKRGKQRQLHLGPNKKIEIEEE